MQGLYFLAPAKPQEASNCFPEPPESTVVPLIAPRGGRLLAVQKTVILLADQVMVCVTTWATGLPKTDHLDPSCPLRSATSQLLQRQENGITSLHLSLRVP